MKRPQWLILLPLALVFAAVVWGVLRFGLPDCDHWQSTIASEGAWAPLAYVVLSVIASLCFLPRTPFVVLAGVSFGVGGAVALDLLASEIGATLGFFIARFIARDYFARTLREAAWLRRAPRIARAIERTSETASEHGLGFVILIRIVHVLPFCPMNYLCGVLPLRYGRYLVGTLVGLLPGTIALAYSGHAFGCALLNGHADLPPNVRNQLIMATLLIALVTVLPIWIHRRKK